jgi:hypothetical protein
MVPTYNPNVLVVQQSTPAQLASMGQEATMEHKRKRKRRRSRSRSRR